MFGIYLVQLKCDSNTAGVRQTSIDACIPLLISAYKLQAELLAACSNTVASHVVPIFSSKSSGQIIVLLNIYVDNSS